MSTGTPWGPTGQLVYERTYSRTKPDGSKEEWPETVARVVDGNLSLADTAHLWPDERDRLRARMERFEIIPAGRHLWASGVKGRQYLFNCHVAGWSEQISDHFAFTFLRLMEGGGVGANYSNRFLKEYPKVANSPKIHIVCDEGHPDYAKMADAGVLSAEFDSDWPGAIEVEDSREGWAEALEELIRDHYRITTHPDRVFDVSRVRSEGARLKTFGGTASGPLPLAIMLQDVARILGESHWLTLDGMSAMEIDHAIAQCVVSGGNRRSARMAIMSWDDWQIEEFLDCKQETGSHWTTNISVEVNDNFWKALEHRLSPGFPDESTTEDDKSVQANLVLEHIAEGMLRNGEPGIWNSELSNRGEPNQVVATNPCGEIPLQPWENCNLGHVNLSAFVDEDGLIDDAGLEDAHRLMTRFLIRATYGDVNDARQLTTLHRNRRIGVGHFGFASYVAKRGIRYSDAPEEREIRWMLDELSDIVDDEAVRYSHDLRIPVPVKKRTIAPTGTIAKLPGVSEGIHPIFAKWFIRRIRFSGVDREQFDTVHAYAQRGYPVETCQYAPNTWVVSIPTKDSLVAEVARGRGEEEAEKIVESAGTLTLDQMLSVQALYQNHWADNAVSYTANIRPEDYSVSDVVQHILHYGRDLKGFTIFPETSMPQAPYERITKAEYRASSGTPTIADSVDENCVSGACPVR